MRKRNWKEYNKQLIQRGSLKLLIDPRLLKASQTRKSHRRGRPVEYRSLVIEFLVFVKVHFKLAYRALQGFAHFFLTKFLPKKKVPHYSLICKRIKQLDKSLPSLPSNRGAVVILDASGMKVYGEGEWKVKVHGRGRPRTWVKVHLAIDSQTQEIVAEAITDKTVGDSKMTSKLLGQLKHGPSQVMADGAYDKAHARKGIRDINAEEIIPPPRNAKYHGKDDARDRAVLEILGLGNDKLARCIWGKLTGYNQRVLVETAFSSLKRLFGERFFSRTRERQRIESRVRCHLINRMRTAKV